MATVDIEAFEAAATAASATVERTTAADAPAVLASAVEAPAVGTPLPYDGVSLPAHVVTDPTPSELDGASTGVTPAGLGVAEYGSVLVESSPAGEAHASLFPARHVAVLPASAIVEGLAEVVERLSELADEGRDAVLTTGPSATADMGELVLGAHGPGELHVVVLEDR